MVRVKETEKLEETTTVPSRTKSVQNSFYFNDGCPCIYKRPCWCTDKATNTKTACSGTYAYRYLRDHALIEQLQTLLKPTTSGGQTQDEVLNITIITQPRKSYYTGSYIIMSLRHPLPWAPEFYSPPSGRKTQDPSGGVA
jgi:hypothetical protein